MGTIMNKNRRDNFSRNKETKDIIINKEINKVNDQIKIIKKEVQIEEEEEVEVVEDKEGSQGNKDSLLIKINKDSNKIEKEVEEGVEVVEEIGVKDGSKDHNEKKTKTKNLI